VDERTRSKERRRVISSGALYCCLLPQCEALRTCRSGFPITKTAMSQYVYVARTNSNRVIASCDLYCCLLPQCEALRTCRSGFPIAIAYRPCPIDLKFSGKMHVHKKKIRLKFGCKRPSMFKVIAPYATTTQPKLTGCQPRAHTISPMCWEQVWLLGSTIFYSQIS